MEDLLDRFHPVATSLLMAHYYKCVLVTELHLLLSETERGTKTLEQMPSRNAGQLTPIQNTPIKELLTPNEWDDSTEMWAPCLPIACDNDVNHLPNCVFDTKESSNDCTTQNLENCF